MNFIGLLRTLEQITRPPRMGHDVDVEDGYDPTVDTSMCGCGHQVRYCECPINDEPGLTDDELVGVRGLLQERYYSDQSCTCPSWGNPSWPHRHGCPADPLKSSASNHAGTGAEPNPSPTIVQSAPPPTVDGEGPASVRDIQPSPEAGRPTSELLTRAAGVIDISAGFASALGYCNEDTGTQLDVFSAELRERAATFEAIEE